MLLEEQIAQAWGAFGEWGAGGVDRVRELADLLRANGVQSLGPVSVRVVDTSYVIDAGWDDAGDSAQRWRPAQNVEQTGIQWRIGAGRWLGFLGDANNDGSISRRNTRAAQGQNRVGWSARGDGNVAYHLGVDAAGVAYIAPSWGSSSDLDKLRAPLLAAAFIVAAAATGGFGLAAIGAEGGAVATGGALASGEVGALTLSAGEFGALTGAAAEGASLGLVGVEGTLTAAGGSGWLSASGTAALEALKSAGQRAAQQIGGRIIQGAVADALAPDAAPMPEPMPMAQSAPSPVPLLALAGLLALIV